MRCKKCGNVINLTIFGMPDDICWGCVGNGKNEILNKNIKRNIMTNIQGIKIGNVMNLSINGKLHKKNCGTNEEATELYKLVLAARENPSDENIKAIRLFLNEKTRIAYLCGLETDLESGEVFLAGFNTPIPLTLLEVIKEYHENGYPLQAILNFWKLLMINPDQRVRTDLFDFIKVHDFTLTDTGYMLAYKAVAIAQKENGDNVLKEYISDQYLHVKKDWKCNPNKYVVYKDFADNTLKISKFDVVAGWDQKTKNVEVLGKLGELYAAIVSKDNEADEAITYTDKYTHKMEIKLGKPVTQERKECDANYRKDCSVGLHIGSTRYVNSFARNSDVILVCLVNPMNVVAVPEYDHSKMRVCEYFPIGVAKYENGKIEVTEQLYFENDYCTYEQKELEEQIAKLQANELPFEAAINAEKEGRPMSELKKMIESRLIDIV